MENEFSIKKTTVIRECELTADGYKATASVKCDETGELLSIDNGEIRKNGAAVGTLYAYRDNTGKLVSAVSGEPELLDEISPVAKEFVVQVRTIIETSN